MATKYNVDKILDKLGLEVILETGVERYLKCPFHTDSDPSFSINSETGLWVCFAGCGQGNIKGLVSRVLDISIYEAGRWLEGYKDVATISTLKQRLHRVGNKLDEPIKRSNSSYWSDGMLKPYYNGMMSSYIFQRGFSKEILKRYEIGYDKRTRDIIIPARDENGILIGIIRRSTTGGIRYINSPGFKKKSLLFGLDKVIIKVGINKVYVGEGPLDIIWMAQAGMQAVGLLGSDMTGMQAQLLVKHFSTVVLVLDNDSAGMKGLEMAKKRLSGKVILLRGVITEGKKDVQEMSLEELLGMKTEWVKGNYERNDLH